MYISRPLAPLVARASAPATCGELAQGWLDGRDFLVNCPISLRSEVSVRLTSTRGVRVTNDGVFTKVARAVERTLDILSQADLGADVTVHSGIPRGKGLASSTSELAAAIAATAAALGRTLSLGLTTRILLDVDGSSDGVHLPGVSLLDHLRGDVWAAFPRLPRLKFAVVDSGGFVETSGFDRDRARAVARANQEKLRVAVGLIREGCRTGNARLVANGATLSARVNQEVLTKGLLEELITATNAAGALGVNCAHTGTILGIMYAPFEEREEAILECLREIVPVENLMGTYELVSGGTWVHLKMPTEDKRKVTRLDAVRLRRFDDAVEHGVRFGNLDEIVEEAIFPADGHGPDAFSTGALSLRRRSLRDKPEAGPSARAVY